MEDSEMNTMLVFGKMIRHEKNEHFKQRFNDIDDKQKQRKFHIPRKLFLINIDKKSSFQTRKLLLS